MYITNQPKVAEIAQKYGVDRIWVDLETLHKEERQRNLDTVKSHHKTEDIPRIKEVLHSSALMVRVNPMNENSGQEIEKVLSYGVDYVMLPMWKTVAEVRAFLRLVRGRTKTILLLETKEAVSCLDDVLRNGGFDELHIGLNDLHLSYGLTFMFELVSNGVVETICTKCRKANIPYGFGGIAQLGAGMLPAEKIVAEHYRLHSTRAILSRSFCNADSVGDLREIENIFRNNMESLRAYEREVETYTPAQFQSNKQEIDFRVEQIVKKKRASIA